MADKLRIQQQLEHLQNRYIGTGHADTTTGEWANNLHRDTIASILGHPPLLHYVSIGMGHPHPEITRIHLMNAFIRPPSMAAVANQTEVSEEDRRRGREREMGDGME